MIADAWQRVRARRHPRPARPWWWWVLIVLGALGVLVSLAGLVGHYRTPGSTVALGLAAFSPYLVLGAGVAAVLFAVARGDAGWVGLACAVAVVGWTVALQLPLFVASAVPAEGRDVVVMTANLRLGQADADAVVAAVRRHHVEVLMLEELTDDERTALRSAGLDRVLPHAVADPRPSAAGTGLWSTYPITDSDVRYDFGFSLITARVAVPGVQPAPTAVALHLYGPYPQPQFHGWAHDIARLPSVLQSLPTDAPVLAGGDFNATPDTAQFRDLLRGGYADAAEQAGAGLTPTYPSDRWYGPLISIDHVLTRDAVASSADSVEIAGSDHRALVVTVRLPG